ncbi:hypothetical protein [Pelagovum sp. HNIBRBA483]|uniref:hypothetical protein n=1 Tax=Pelagovum sp. HNIBRBA483 TaxID=3233341 RepID=UPI0034A1C5D4
MFRFALAIALFLGSPALAQNAHNHDSPAEVGQSAFAALAEIVDMLRQNPHTDWDSVDIPTLQKHLVDMELLATQSVALQTKVDNAVQFSVTGEPEVIEALHRMVPAHAPFLDAETGWTTKVEINDSGVVVRVKGDAQVIVALGFHGLMTIGAHHQEHHFGIATGTMSHD